MSAQAYQANRRRKILLALKDMFCLGLILSDILVFILSDPERFCDFDNVKSSFYRAFNAVYEKIGRYGSEEVILKFIYSKCFPCLFYAIEACPVNKTQKKSLEFTINRMLMKLFRAVSSDLIKECRCVFGITDTTLSIVKRKMKFLRKYCNSENGLCKLFADAASLNVKCWLGLYDW